jgi:hypothetical protein
MVPLSDLRLMQVKGLPLSVLRDKIMAELQLAERLDMLEGCGEMPLHPPSVRGLLILWVADVRSGGQTRTFRHLPIKSALPRKADIARRGHQVRKVPLPESCAAAKWIRNLLSPGNVPLLIYERHLFVLGETR